MKRRLLITCMALLLGLAATAQRSCGLWLNEVPLVADTAAGCLYATIEPCVGSALKGTLRWDEGRYNGVMLNEIALENGRQANVDISDWTANASNTLIVSDSVSRQWTLMFSTLPFVVVDCPLDEMEKTYSI